MHASLALPTPALAANPAATVEDLIARVDGLLSLPDAALRLNTVLSDPDTSAEEIAQIVSVDPALAARVLRAVNSAYFGLRGRVDAISKAITIIGTSGLHSLVLATSAALAFRNISCKLVDMESFWQHSVRAALAARGLAEAGGLRPHRERIFLAALLHDVGQLILYHQLPDVSTRILHAVRAGRAQDEVEHELLGFTHAEVGALLLERWSLPPSLTRPVRFPHRYDEAPEFGREAALIHIGSRVVHMLEQERSADRPPYLDVAPDAWSQSGCAPDVLEEVIVDVDMHWLQVIEIVAPGSMQIY
jgi:HD-like signal output (HDOD) protein